MTFTNAELLSIINGHCPDCAEDADKLLIDKERGASHSDAMDLITDISTQLHHADQMLHSIHLADDSAARARVIALFLRPALAEVKRLHDYVFVPLENLDEGH